MARRRSASPLTCWRRRSKDRHASQSDTALADVALAIGGLMQRVPEISEIDINPPTVHGKGEDATARVALTVVG